MKSFSNLLALCVASTAISLSGCARSQESLEVMDGLSLGIDEASFRRLHPEAIDLSDSRYPSSSTRGYFPAHGTKYFGHRVTGYSRGFENGQGCASFVALEKLTTNEIEQMKGRIHERVSGTIYPEYQAGNTKSLITRYAGDQLRASISVKASNDSQNIFSVGISVSLAKCDERLAKFLWGTAPR